MFYNCAGDFFKRVRVENKNQNTRQQHPYTVFPSTSRFLSTLAFICSPPLSATHIIVQAADLISRHLRKHLRLHAK